MQTIQEKTLAPNEGWRTEVAAGQTLRIEGRSVIDFIAFRKDDPREYFDTARTRIYNLNLYPTAGQRLFSKQNNPMMRFVRDDFAAYGHHDLQSGHSCTEAMLELAAPLGVSADDLPDPLGFYRNLAIRQEDGAISPAPVAPDAPVRVELEAETDLIVALVNCPDPETSGPAADADIAVLAP